MNYPYCLLTCSQPIFPLLGKQPRGLPLLFDFSDRNDQLSELDAGDQEGFERYVRLAMERRGNIWGIAGYLEHRSLLLRHLPQMVTERRFYHLGIDIIVPPDTALYAPLPGTIIEQGYEAGQGNYGGYSLIRHQLEGVRFFSFYGHLKWDPSAMRSGSRIEAGEILGTVGGMEENGGWFHHTHLQILTPRALEEGFIEKGYCTLEMLPEIDRYCPSPLFLFRY